MAPMTGRVSDGEEYRFVFDSGFRECLIAPWVPVNWVVGVLQEVRGFFVYELVGVFMISHFVDLSPIMFLLVSPRMQGNYLIKSSFFISTIKF